MFLLSSDWMTGNVIFVFISSSYDKRETLLRFIVISNLLASHIVFPSMYRVSLLLIMMMNHERIEKKEQRHTSTHARIKRTRNQGMWRCGMESFSLHQQQLRFLNFNGLWTIITSRGEIGDSKRTQQQVNCIDSVRQKQKPSKHISRHESWANNARLDSAHSNFKQMIVKWNSFDQKTEKCSPNSFQKYFLHFCVCVQCTSNKS